MFLKKDEQIVALKHRLVVNNIKECSDGVFAGFEALFYASKHLLC